MLKLASGFSLKELKIEVTYNCGLSCLHCSSEASPISQKSMSWDSCKRILNEAKEMGVSEISFSGGEPLMWNEIIAAVSHASKLGMTVIMYSSGNFKNVKSTLKNLKSSGLEKIIFSIFDHEAEFHDYITATKGSFENTIRSASISQDLGLNTEFHFVPFSINYKRLPKIVRKAALLGIKTTSLLRFVPQGRGKEKTEWQLSKPQNIELQQMVKNLSKEGYSIRLGSPYNFLLVNENPQCLSGIDRLTIGPDLRIFPCDAFKQIRPEEIGIDADAFSSITLHSLQECWNNSVFLNKIRECLEKDIEGECRQCSLLNQCNTGCIAQKIISFGSPFESPDPMCLKL